MSPIEPGSKLGRVIAIKEELIDLLHKIKTIKNALNPTSYEPLIAKVTFKLLPTTIKKINKSWTTYFQSIPVSSINEYEHRVNSTIANINTRGGTIKNMIKNMTLNNLTLDFISINLITNLDGLDNQTSTAISQVAKLVSILDIGDRIAQASNRRQYRSLPLPPPPSPHLSPLSPLPPTPPFSAPPPSPPFSAPPQLRRQPNLGTQQRSLVRQEATHLLLDGLDDLDGLYELRLGQGKKFFKKRRLTHRNKLRDQKSKKHYKTRRA